MKISATFGNIVAILSTRKGGHSLVHCDEYKISILLYLDDELKGQKLEDFQNHLATCATCKVRLGEEQALSLLLRRTRPLYSVPESLRARVGAGGAGQGPVLVDTPDEPRRQVRRMLPHALRNPVRPSFNWGAIAATTFLFFAGFAFLPVLMRQARAADYIDLAVATHQDYLSGNLPLEFQSDSPQAVTAWFADKVPFHFQLPNYQSEQNGKPTYRLTGARLVNYHGSHAALVSYDMQAEKISLLVASSDLAVAIGGDKVQSDGLTFHYHRNANFKVITWTNHGLTYALVSSLAGSAQGSCLVCHQNMRDEERFKVSER